MAVTDKDVQDLQSSVKQILKEGIPDDGIIPIGDKENPTYYKVIHYKNDVTQGLGVVPVDNENGANPQYDQTIIVIAGTQPGIPYMPGRTGESTGNAIDARKDLTVQTKDIEDFYNQVLKREPKAQVAVISGHSQAGPGTAKIGAEKKIPRIYNFQPWASYSAVQSVGLTRDNIDYLNKHAIVYSDQGKSVTVFDNNHGKIAYGKVRTVEGRSHKVPFFVIKGNGLDIDKYVKKGKFCSGMTEDQVRQVAKKKAAATFGNWDDEAEIKRMVEEYEAIYGPFATISTVDDIRSKNKKARKSLKTASGVKKIALREEIIRNTAKIARVQADDYEKEVNESISNAKQAVQNHINTFITEVNMRGTVLPYYEIAAFLEEFTMQEVWDESIERSTLEVAKKYKERLYQCATSLDKVAKNIVETDKSGMLLFQ